MRKVPGLEAIDRDYRPQGVNIYYVYKSLAHPEHNGYIDPYTLKERLLHIREAERTLGTKIPWLCDTMDNDLKHALGDAPNSEFVIDSEGRIVRKRAWSNPNQLRKDLAKLVGPVEKPTKVSDLNLKTAPPPMEAARGVVERIARPPRMQAVRIQPLPGDNQQPFYAKLRAEAEPQLLGGGSGKLYLGFHMDPIYRVHWNNLVKPLKVTVEAPQGVKVASSEFEAPQPDVEADVDPREFLIDVETAGSEQPLKLNVDYFACNDEQGWCKPVKQAYRVYLERDPDAGWVRGGRARRPRRARVAGEANRGRIVEVDTKARTIVVRFPNGGRKTYQVSQDVVIRRNRETSKLDDLKPGDFCRFRLDQSGDDNKSIERLQARDRPASPAGPRLRRK